LLRIGCDGPGDENTAGLDPRSKKENPGILNDRAPPPQQSILLSYEGWGVDKSIKHSHPIVFGRSRVSVTFRNLAAPAARKFRIPEGFSPFADLILTDPVGFREIDGQLTNPTFIEIDELAPDHGTNCYALKGGLDLGTPAFGDRFHLPFRARQSDPCRRRP